MLLALQPYQLRLFSFCHCHPTKLRSQFHANAEPETKTDTQMGRHSYVHFGHLRHIAIQLYCYVATWLIIRLGLSDSTADSQIPCLNANV